MVTYEASLHANPVIEGCIEDHLGAVGNDSLSQY